LEIKTRKYIVFRSCFYRPHRSFITDNRCTCIYNMAILC